MVKKLILSLFILFSFCSAFTVQNETKIQLIDQQIQELQDKKLGFEGKAILHEDQADRLQFNDETYLETRRHFQLAEENRAKAQAVQQEIERLQLERSKLLNSKRSMQ
jgi:hypothetical protein